MGVNLTSFLLLVISIIITPVKSDESFSLFTPSLPSYLYRDEENPEPELVVIDNLYITNRLYGTEVIVDPYAELNNDRPGKFYEEEYDDEDEEW